MAENSGFFNAHLIDGEYDRVYLAENFAKYFASFIRNGVFAGKANQLAVQQQDVYDMSVRVMSGQGWINGYWYENDDDYTTLTIDTADGVLNRIDTIVLRWSKLDRVIRLAVSKGTSATSPTAPLIQRNTEVYELKLAEVYVKAGATLIKQENITDTRFIDDDCGFVAGLVQQIDTEDIGRQLRAFIDTSMTEYDSWYSNYQTTNQAAVDALLKSYEDALAATDVATINASLTDIASRLATLESSSLKQSGPNPGCYYRTASDGSNEWVNPPNEVGIEYRTDERWRGKVVYRKLFYTGALPNQTFMGIDTDIRFDRIVSVSGFAIDNDNNLNYPFPVTINGLVPAAVITYIEGDGGNGSTIVIKTNEDISSFVGYITVKYTKD